MDLMFSFGERLGPNAAEPDKNYYWQLLKRNDHSLTDLCVALAKNPRSAECISAAIDIAELGRDIGKCTTLKDLNIEDLYCMDDRDVVLSQWMFSLLCHGINNNESIEEITIGNFGYSNWHIGQCLGPLLANNANLRMLCLMTGGGCTASAENMRLLVSPLLKRSNPLEELAFCEAGLDDDMVIELVDVFLNKPSLAPIKLQIAACGLVGLVSFRALATLLKQPGCTMKVLELPENNIDDDGAKYLAEALAVNNTLQELSLEGNRITAKGWEVFDQVSCLVWREHKPLPPPGQRWS